ncbi:hypothetical protein [Sporisorium scitamineum]|uniref:Uncharacterized protein n=1 Tax=Sporisorium scitamineum TaxID=49012 RepID=A0A0F7SAR7_9BASI|nr:hypothetical protein [Sporisorium scitamineum]
MAGEAANRETAAARAVKRSQKHRIRVVCVDVSRSANGMLCNTQGD